MKKLLLALALGVSAFGQTTYLGGSLTIEGTTNYCGSDTGSGNAFVCANPSNAKIGAYRSGHEYSFTATHSNTGAATLAIDGLSAIPIKKWNAGSLVDTISGDIQSGSPFGIRYNGTYFILGGAATGNGSASVTNPGGTSGQVQFNSAGVFGGFDLSGDATLNTGTGAFTLATVNGSPGSCGDATHSCQFTTNAKGLVTTQTAVAISGAGGGGCSYTKYTVPYNDSALTGVSSATPTKTLVTLATNKTRICGIEISGTTSFTGIANLTAATVRLQSSAGTPMLYSPNQDIFGAVGLSTNNYWTDAGSTADRTSLGVVAAFTFTCSSGTCLSSGLSAGSVDVTVGTMVLP